MPYSDTGERVTIAFFVLGEASARPSTTVTDGRRRVFVAGASGLIGVRPVPLLDSEAA